MAYLDGDIPYDDRLMELFNAVDTMETIGYHPNNVKYIKKIYVNHKNNTVKIEVRDYRENPMMLQIANMDIKTLSGKTEYFYPNGKLFSTMNVKNGVLDGEAKLYYENGKLKSIVYYKNDRIDGIVEYDKSGKLLHKSIFENGTGDWKLYWSNGKVSEEGKYVSGRKDGVWKKYREDGSLDTILKYDNGRLLSEKWQ